MPRRKANTTADISIRGDELEQNRIRLENNLQDTDLSLHLTSPTVEDVEFPRHNSGPEHFNGFVSFEHHSQDHLDPDENSQFNAWSYRTVDDEDGIDPYAGQTISTAAHHASALTLSAGLGGRGARRDVSISGAEYDPDRPLQGIMAGITSRISAFNMDDTKSNNFATVDFDPLVVDDSADLIALGQKKRRIPASGLRSPSTSSSSSRPATPLSPRPTLADALSSVAFSPKRPRSNHSDLTAKPTVPLARSTRQPSRTQARTTEENVPASRTRNKPQSSYGVFPQQSLSYATVIEPEVNVQPPTPISAEENPLPTRAARSGNREAESEMNRQKRYGDNAAVSQNVKRRPSGKPNVDYAPREPRATHPRVGSLRTPYRDKVHLPDVTGLTSAIASPARVGLEYLGYDAQDDAEINARLATTLGVVQAKLAHLEAQNSISRRRVRELELELEECKHEVVRERTRVLEREQVISQQRVDVRTQKQITADNARIAQERISEADRSRYKEVVEEQKALQALVMTLKGHLTRLTTELSDHHRLLEDLRGLRNTDVRALKDKSREVDNLRQEVERLGGEVEVLRGVVEEGLKQRREVREQSVEQSRSSHSDSKSISRPNEDSMEVVNRTGVAELSDNGSEDGSSDGHSVSSPTPSPQRRTHLADKTMRTDQATLGSPQNQADVSSHPFIDSQELERISEEVSERRIERSVSTSTVSSQHHSHSHLSIRGDSPAPSVTSSRGKRNAAQARPEIPDSEDEETVPQRRQTNVRVPSPSSHRGAAKTQETRIASSTHDEEFKTNHAGASSINSPPLTQTAETEPPLPRIRGAYLERLFFSAPDHHANTCTVCSRRQRRKASHKDSAPWDLDLLDDRNLKERLHDAEARAEDGASARGPGGATYTRRPSTKGKERAGGSEEDRVPPQTVLARVLRELEGDFTHYKEIYIELADQYKDIDPVTNVAKRNVLAEHLREVIDILEQKGDQIASLYDLLTFRDKLTDEADGPHKSGKPRTARESEPSIKS